MRPEVRWHKRLKLAQWTGQLLAAALRLLAATWRAEAFEGLGHHNGDAAPRLIVFWHGKYFPLLLLLRGTRGAVLIGEGRRGERIAAICESFGYTPVFLPHGDPKAAIARMREALGHHAVCATALDGPQGPTHRAKSTLLRVASEVGAWIVPVSVRATPSFVCWWRWDRREIPYPFARVQLAVGAPIGTTNDAAESAIASWQCRIESTLGELEGQQS